MIIVTLLYNADQVGYDADSGIRRVAINERYYRPTEVDLLLGDASKAKKTFGWEAETKFDDLVKEMVEADIKLMKSQPNA